LTEERNRYYKSNLRVTPEMKDGLGAIIRDMTNKKEARRMEKEQAEQQDAEKAEVLEIQEPKPVPTMTIHQTLNRILGDMNAIGKTQKNKTQNFAYRGIDQVYNAINPLMAKYGLITVPRVLERSQEYVATRNGGQMKNVLLKVAYDFVGLQGDKVTAEVYGEAADNGDKATSKALAIAHKYAVFQLFCIPTEEIRKIDPDQYSHQMVVNNQRKPKPEVKRSPTLKTMYEKVRQLTGAGKNKEMTDKLKQYLEVKRWDELDKIPDETLKEMLAGLDSIK